MAIGTLAAIGLGMVGAGTAISGVAGASAAKSAAKTAAQASTEAADKSAAVIEANYNKSAAALAPWQSQGLQANALINAALGITPTQPVQSYGTPTYTQQSVQPNALAQFNEVPTYGAYPGGMYDGMGRYIEDYSYLSPNAMGNMSSNGGGWGMAGGGYAIPQMQQQAVPTAGTVSTPLNPQSALDTYLNSTGYKFALGEGLNALNGGFASRGLMQSGARDKSALRYGMGMAQQGYGDWLAALGNQQTLGASAASAQAGVSQNVGNSLASVYQGKGDAIANAALASANSGIAGAFGNSLAAMGGLGFGILGK